MENPHLLRQYTRWDLFGQKKKKLIFLALLFTEVLKFALLKSSQIKFRKSKISCRLRQNEYPEEVIISGIKKKISNFKHPSGSAQKSVRYI